MFVLVYIATFISTIFLAVAANKYNWVDNAWIFPVFYVICFSISLFSFYRIPIKKYRIIDYGLNHEPFQFKVQWRYFFFCWKDCEKLDTNGDWRIAYFQTLENATNFVFKLIEIQTREINYKKNHKKIIPMDRIIKLKSFL